MRYTISGSIATVAICLASFQPALAETNNENDPRAFIVRDAEIREAKAAEEAGTEAPKPAAEIKAPFEKTAAKRLRTAGGKATAKTAASAKSDAPATDTEAAASAEEPTTSVKAAPAGTTGLAAIVARHAAANGVPFSLADAIVRVESRYNPRAAHAGNFGLMQIRHQTARGVGYSGGAAGLLDAETNARFGMKYLAQAYRLAGGDTCRTIMKYQSGHMATRMSGANRVYCAKVRTISARS